MSNLKTNWAILTTDDQFKAYILTLEALGYRIYQGAKSAIDNQNPMGVCSYLACEIYTKDVRRNLTDGVECIVNFPDISSFLIYHFSEEKTEAEKELESLQEKMNSLQEQIDRVKLSISK